jgi:glycosyltransferase involved in cell wall biosynthesis
MTDPLGESQVLAYLIGLQQTGAYSFTLVSFEKPGPYQAGKERIEKLCAASGIAWHPFLYTSKPPVLSTFKDVRQMRRVAEALVKQQSFFAVHCRSYIPSLVGLYLKRKYGIPFIFDMRGFWADERIDGGIWNLSNPFYKAIYIFFKKKETAFLQHADQVVSLTHNAKKEIQSWRLVPGLVPITVIPCCVDFALFDPAKITKAQKNDALASLQIPPDAQVLSYLGSLGTWYMLPEMMAFAATYRKNHPDTYFMILTGEPDELVQQAAVAAGFDTAYLRIKKVPRSVVPAYLSVSTLSIFFIKPAFSKRASSPVKQGEIMAMGVPIVCNGSVGDTAEIITETAAGVVVNGFTNEHFQMAIQQLDTIQFNPVVIREGAARYFTLTKGIDLYRSVYEKIDA